MTKLSSIPSIYFWGISLWKNLENNKLTKSFHRNMYMKLDPLAGEPLAGEQL